MGKGSLSERGVYLRGHLLERGVYQIMAFIGEGRFIEEGACWREAFIR